MTNEIPTICIEVMLLRWQESSNGGATIVLQLADPDDLEPFKLMTIAKGKIAGQRLQAVFVEIGENEKPIERPKGGSLSRLAGRWCADPEFQTWCKHKWPDSWQQVRMWFAEDASAENLDNEQVAAEHLRRLLVIGSRAELDHDKDAAARFDTLIRRPYMARSEETSAPGA